MELESKIKTKDIKNLMCDGRGARHWMFLSLIHPLWIFFLTATVTILFHFHCLLTP